MLKNLVNNLILAVGVVATFFVLASTYDAPQLGSGQVEDTHAMQWRDAAAKAQAHNVALPDGCTSDAHEAKREGMFNVVVIPNDWYAAPAFMDFDRVVSVAKDKTHENDVVVLGFCADGVRL